MTYDKWRATIDPKVKGTWNLHSFFPSDVEFFVILSSMSGVMGNAGQANYSAGNTYEDAFAHYRRGIGLAATSLDIGLVTDADHFGEGSTFSVTSEEYIKKYSHWSSMQVTLRELLIVLRMVLRGDGEASSFAQLLIGVGDGIQRRHDGTGWQEDRKFDHRIDSSATAAGPEAGQRSIGERMRRAQDIAEVTTVVEDAIRAKIADATALAAADIDLGKPLFTFGSKETQPPTPPLALPFPVHAHRKG